MGDTPDNVIQFPPRESRRRLHVDTARGRITGGRAAAAQMRRIQVHLENINRLMSELRALAERDRRLSDV